MVDTKKGLKGVAVGVALAITYPLVTWVGWPCLGAWAQYGMVLDECPDGQPRLVATVSSHGVERNREGTVEIQVSGSWITDERAWPTESAFGDFDAELFLVDGETETALACEDPSDWRGYLSCQVTLPLELDDGDYVLRARLDTALGEHVVDVELPLYKPAHIHVLTDRPLYEPGNTLQFRSLALRKGSLEPLDTRPGTWTVTDPHGEVVLEERSDGGTWGVSSSSLPLSQEAPVGDWTVRFVSGQDSGQTTVRVEPFTLPRFTVEAFSDAPWYGLGDAITVEGSVSYNSGAPVAGAQVDLQLVQTGAWPPPNDWTEPHQVFTEADGSFSWTLGEVPTDLVDPSDLRVMVRVTDSDGDTASGGTSLRLSPDPLLVEAVTELGDGLVADFNNRVYLRVTSPDGRPLDETEIRVQNRWDPRDEGKTVTTDEDGVAALQLDPGQPVNVEVPAQPIRPPRSARVLPFQVRDISPLQESRVASIAERRAASEAVEGLEGCRHLVDANGEMVLGLASSGGVVRQVAPRGTALERCVAERLVGRALGRGEGLYELRITRQIPNDISRLSLFNRSPAGTSSEAEHALDEAAAEASACVLERPGEDRYPRMIYWSVAEGSERLALRWVEDQQGSGSWPERGCIERAFTDLSLDQPSERDELGLAWLENEPPVQHRTQRPQPTVMPGFEYVVAVDELGETSWRSSPGAVPWLRLRPSKVLLEGGETFEVELLRGPDYAGDLPISLSLRDVDGRVMQCPRTPEIAEDEAYAHWWSTACPEQEDDNTVRFQVPPGREGFMVIEEQGARAVVFVRPAAELALEISTDGGSFRPGDEVLLNVKTSSPAVVTLSGVDSTLGQLAPLTQASELNELTLDASASSPAWGIYDAMALTSGRMRGENAMMATVLRVDSLIEEDRSIPWMDHYGSTAFDPEEEAQSAFWEVLGDLQAAVREWEASAPEGDPLDNARLAGIYEDVLDARERAELPCTDAWGRRLELWRLPDHLLQMTEPRALVLDATRLPEDVEQWTWWVRQELER